MNYKALRDLFFKWLRGEWVKLALKKILGSAAMGGIQGWIVAYVAEYLYDEIAVPVMKYLIRKGLFYYDVEQGKIEYKRLEEAKKEEDESTYDDVIDNV